MKIAILTTSYPRYLGDFAGNFVHELAKRLVQHGLQVEVVAPHESGVPKQEMMDGVKVTRFSYMFPNKWQRIAYLGGIPANLRRYPMAWLQLPLFGLSFWLAARRASRGSQVVHAYWIYAAFIARLLPFRRQPVVLTVQGSDINILANNPLLRRLRTSVLKRIQRIIAVSQPLAERVRQLAPEKGKTVMIPNGVDVRDFPSGSGENEFSCRLVWVGRMSPEKGLVHLIDAMPAVTAAFPAARLTLVGDGPLRPDIEHQINQLEMKAHIGISGMVSHAEIPGFLAQADLFILPSLNEGLPLSLLEAMSAGKPAVATHVGGIPDVLVEDGPRPTGKLVPDRDSVALAAAINEILSDPENALVMGQNARDRVQQHFAWGSIAEQTIAVYRSLL